MVTRAGMNRAKYFIAWLLFICVIVIVCAFVGKVHATDTKPVLTNTQKLQVQNMLQQIQIAQLHQQIAAEELQRAQLVAQNLLQTLLVKGYALNLQTLEYEQPQPEPKK